MPRTPRVPTYRLHKSTGQAVVTLAGHDHYLGAHGTEESRRRYEQLLAEYLAAGRRDPAERAPDLTVSEVLAAYWGHAQDYYAGPGGEPTSQLDRVRRSLGPARDLYGPTRARDFGPAALRACRQRMIAAGWCRRVVNQRVGCLVRAWKWAVSEELVPPAVYQGLRAVEGLRAGRSEAPESEPVRPVPEADAAAALPHLLPVLRDVVRLQLLTAMRPGEALALRPADVERQGDVWTYRPASHKTRWRGHGRAVLLGPQAQALLAPYLLRDAGAYCFCPREAVSRRWAELGRTYRPGRTRRPGDRYRVDSYARAVRKACAAAGVEPWHPHALRHTAATQIVEAHGWDTARIILGHRTLDATRIYADDALARAAEVVRKIG